MYKRQIIANMLCIRLLVILGVMKPLTSMLMVRLSVMHLATTIIIARAHPIMMPILIIWAIHTQINLVGAHILVLRQRIAMAQSLKLVPKRMEQTLFGLGPSSLIVILT